MVFVPKTNLLKYATASLDALIDLKQTLQRIKRIQDLLADKAPESSLLAKVLRVDLHH